MHKFLTEVPPDFSTLPAASYRLGDPVEVGPAYRMVHPTGGRLVDDEVTGPGWFITQICADNLGLCRANVPGEVSWWVHAARVRPCIQDPSLHPLTQAAAAGTAAAIDAHKTGVPKAPAQCQVVAQLIKDPSSTPILELLKAWSSAYHKKLYGLSDEELAELGVSLDRGK